MGKRGRRSRPHVKKSKINNCKRVYIGDKFDVLPRALKYLGFRAGSGNLMKMVVTSGRKIKWVLYYLLIYINRWFWYLVYWALWCKPECNPLTQNKQQEEQCYFTRHFTHSYSLYMPSFIVCAYKHNELQLQQYRCLIIFWVVAITYHQRPH